ncbi:uncharacterized protein LOC110816583 [Carica papaya]|uniref:uncharacterized protein LOC110816583 n=1 Tax=Carica papaya TaxID=3649 RepID=UPI000B8CFEEE|nr:uncharacterized protein LOC110816583 [Carica papaya]
MSSSVTSTSTSWSGVRCWRTAFLTLRDETLTSPPPPLAPLLQNLIFSHHHSLLSAASELPPHEVTSDLLFLLELVATANASHGGDAGEMIPASAHTCRLIHDVCYRVSLQLNPSSWTLVLNCFAKILDFLLGAPGNTPSVSPNANASAPRTRTVMDCLETLRRFTIYRKTSVSEDVHLVKFLLNSIECLQTDLVFSYRYRQSSSANAANRCSGLWEFQALAFTMLGEAFSASGSSFPRDICQSIIEVLRKVMDVLGSKSLLVEDNVMSRFYASLLQCLHLILVDPKVPLSDHVSSFVSALRMFFVYGLSSRIQPSCPDVAHKEKQPDLMTLNLNAQEPKRRNHAPYRPPHLRKKESINLKQDKVLDSQCLSDHESSVVDLTSLDSDYSDSEKSLNDPDCVQRSKVRVAALVCLQVGDLCQADPKSFTSQLTILLPTNDVLRPRKFEATLMTVLLFDPYLKARMTSASTLAVMMDGLSSVFLQVAEYKESNKYGSFMALSSSLGLILMQLHTGILYLVQCETHSRLLGSLFKILVLLISCTPYSRMPGDLLPTVITSLEKRIGEGFLFKTDQTGLLVAAMGCLTAALCTSPSLLQVREILLEEISTVPPRMKLRQVEEDFPFFKPSWYQSDSDPGESSRLSRSQKWHRENYRLLYQKFHRALTILLLPDMAWLNHPHHSLLGIS